MRVELLSTVWRSRGWAFVRAGASDGTGCEWLSTYLIAPCGKAWLCAPRLRGRPDRAALTCDN